MKQIYLISNVLLSATFFSIYSMNEDKFAFKEETLRRMKIQEEDIKLLLF